MLVIRVPNLTSSGELLVSRCIYMKDLRITSYFRKIQTLLQRDNINQHKALHDEKRRAEDATEKAKEIIKVCDN